MKLRRLCRRHLVKRREIRRKIRRKISNKRMKTCQAQDHLLVERHFKSLKSWIRNPKQMEKPQLSIQLIWTGSLTKTMASMLMLSLPSYWVCLKRTLGLWLTLTTTPFRSWFRKLKRSSWVSPCSWDSKRRRILSLSGLISTGSTMTFWGLWAMRALRQRLIICFWVTMSTEASRA